MEETKNKAAPVIRLQDVRKEYVVGDSHIHALDGVSLTVSPGEFVCISGRSGSGKSTMLNMLAGLEKPTSGEIVILDKHIENMSESARIRFRRQYIGFVFQSYNLMPQYTAVENVELPLKQLDKFVSDEDVVFVLSVANSTPELAIAAKHSKKKGAKLVVCCCTSGTELEALADVFILGLFYIDRSKSFV